MSKSAAAKSLSWFRALDAYPKPLEEFRTRTFFGGALSLVASILILWLTFLQYARYLDATASFSDKGQLVVDTDALSAKMRVAFDVTFFHTPCSALGIDAMDASGAHIKDVQSHIMKRRYNPANGMLLDERGIIHKLTDDADTIVRHEPKDVGGDFEGGAAKSCGSCYGAESKERPCCNSCQEIRAAYGEKKWAFKPDDHQFEQCEREKIMLGLTKSNGGTRPDEGCNVAGYVLVPRAKGNVHFAPHSGFNLSSRAIS